LDPRNNGRHCLKWKLRGECARRIADVDERWSEMAWKAVRLLGMTDRSVLRPR
jgi:hypothetical protein